MGEKTQTAMKGSKNFTDFILMTAGVGGGQGKASPFHE